MGGGVGVGVGGGVGFVVGVGGGVAVGVGVVVGVGVGVGVVVGVGVGVGVAVGVGVGVGVGVVVGVGVGVGISGVDSVAIQLVPAIVSLPLVVAVAHRASIISQSIAEQSSQFGGSLGVYPTTRYGMQCQTLSFRT